MKTCFKNNIKLFVGIFIGLVISGISVYALSVASKDVSYDNTNSISEKVNVQDAIDDLYSKINAVDVVYVTSNWKQAVSWNDKGLGRTLYINNDYVSYSTNKVTVKKNFKAKIYAGIYNTNAPSSAPQYQFYTNSTRSMSITGTATAESSTTKNVTVNLSAGDVLYARMYGGGEPTWYVTIIEKVD